MSYVLRKIDPTLWKQFKRRVGAEGHTIRWVLLDLIRRYVSEAK